MSTQVLVSTAETEGLIAKAIMQSGLSCKEEILATPTLEEEEEYGKLFVELTGAKNPEELRSLSAEEMPGSPPGNLTRKCGKPGTGL